MSGKYYNNLTAFRYILTTMLLTGIGTILAVLFTPAELLEYF